MAGPNRTNATRHQVFFRNAAVKSTAISSTDTVTIPSGAAGSVVNFALSYHSVANAAGTDIGGEGDTSIAIASGVVFTTQVGFKEDADLANGEFYVDHLTGKCRGKKATTGTSMGFTYNIFVLQTNASSSSSSSGSSVGGGASTYSNVSGDFTATANSGAKTITFSSYASTVLSSVISTKNFANAVIKRISSAGAVDTLPLTNISFSANVLTLSDMSANFASGDTVAVFVPGPDKAFDETNDNQKVAEVNSLSGEDSSVGVIKTEQRYSYGKVTADGQIKSGAGFIHTITFAATGTVTAGKITIYDNTAESGTTVWEGIVQLASSPTTIILDISVGTGIYVGYDGTIANVSTTVSYR
jgi:hypothetical protein